MAATKKHYLFSTSRIVFYILSLLVFYFALHYISKLEDIKALLLEMRPVWLLLAVAAQITSYVLNAFILKVLIKSNSDKIGFFTLLKISLVVIFVNQALPTGGLSGNGYIFNQLVKRGVNATSAFYTLIMESICYYLAFLLLLLVFYNWYIFEKGYINSFLNYAAIIGFTFYAFLFLVMVILSNKKTVAFLLRKLEGFPRLQQYIEKVNIPVLTKNREGVLKRFFNDKQKSLSVIALQCGIIFCDVLTAFFILEGFHVMLSFHYVVLGLLLSLGIGALPISPGSLVVYESAMTYIFTILGLPVHAALILTLLYRFLTFWLPIPIGLFLYKNLQKRTVA